MKHTEMCTQCLCHAWFLSFLSSSYLPCPFLPYLSLPSLLYCLHPVWSFSSPAASPVSASPPLPSGRSEALQIGTHSLVVLSGPHTLRASSFYRESYSCSSSRLLLLFVLIVFWVVAIVNVDFARVNIVVAATYCWVTTASDNMRLCPPLFPARLLLVYYWLVCYCCRYWCCCWNCFCHS